MSLEVGVIVYVLCGAVAAFARAAEERYRAACANVRRVGLLVRGETA